MKVDNAYLPGTVRERIQDLLKEHHVTQADLAVRIDCSESTLSRFLSEKTDKLGDEHIIRIARAFGVSTDFLLGVTDIPDRKNYEISELGLSVQAARNLYTGKGSTDVINRLLESPRFLEVTYMIERYLDDTYAAGFAAQNQTFATLSAILRGNVKTDAALQAEKAINRSKVPVYQADLTTIQNQFMLAISEVKKEVGSDFTAVRRIMGDATRKMFAELTKGQDMQHLSVTPEQVAQAITDSISGMEGAKQEQLDKLSCSLAEFFQSTLEPPDKGTNDANPEQ
ncbi:MAG: helix-turn-helix domain-containing protein [Clostridiales bacterium]|nr:helix-turn-helix domain-containing protein [Clostridiales bacterium]